MFYFVLNFITIFFKFHTLFMNFNLLNFIILYSLVGTFHYHLIENLFSDLSISGK